MTEKLLNASWPRGKGSTKNCVDVKPKRSRVAVSMMASQSDSSNHNCIFRAKIFMALQWLNPLFTAMLVHLLDRQSQFGRKACTQIEVLVN
ncbi:hypothetical protein [Rhodoferax sp. UBA5149]|uniref:hypothetical protein n=1 Tax=Rhodoferax sp. UBA5149 TaxID=1947379 RepID=UPI0025EC7E94|nr:hypothetical protein [Rhodoferax sp. UBA5149]